MYHYTHRHWELGHTIRRTFELFLFRPVQMSTGFWETRFQPSVQGLYRRGLRIPVRWFLLAGSKLDNILNIE